MPSTNKLQGITPSCIVTVYFTGTGTQVPGSSIFKDAIGTVLGNPFTASANGQYLFYAATGVGLDVVKSSGTTDTDVIPGGGSGGGGTTTHPLTMDASGAGVASGSTFNGSAAEDLSYNTIGAQQLSMFGTGVPSAPCSATQNNGAFYTDVIQNLFQCSNVSGTYMWSQVGPSLNCSSASVYSNILCFGGVADYVQGGYSSATIGGSNVVSATGLSFTSADIGKYVMLQNNSAGVPFPADKLTPGNVAKIVSVTNSSTVVVNKTALVTGNSSVAKGTDNVPAAGACITSLASSGGSCSWLAGNWGLFTYAVDNQTNFNPVYSYAFGASDTGDYGNGAGGAGATFSCTVTTGQVSSCSVTAGGAHYTNGNTSIVNFSGGCPAVYAGPCGGALATVGVNGSGVVVNPVTMVFEGYGYTTPPTASANPTGGDGATGSCVLSSGTCGTPSIGSGGSGYTLSSSTAVQIFTASTVCTTNGHGYATSNASGVIVSAAWTTAPSGCGSSTPTILFGDSACWTSGTTFTTQCTNLAPLLPAAIPVQIALKGGTSWFGPTASSLEGVNLYGPWDGVTVDTVTPGAMLTQSAMYGGLFQNEDIGNLAIEQSFIGILADNNANQGAIHDAVCFTGVCILTSSMDQGMKLNNIQSYGNAGIVNGGHWAHRTDLPEGAGGFFDVEAVSNIDANGQGPTTVSAAIDQWFNEYAWKAEYTAYSSDMYETCALGGNTAAQRGTSVSNTVPQHANTECYKGVTGLGLVNLSRDNRGAGGHNIATIIGKYLWRPIYYGSLGSSALWYESCEGCVPLVTDPWRAESEQEGAIEVISAYNAQIYGLSWAGGSILQDIYDMSGQAAAGVPGQPQGIGWDAADQGWTTASPQQPYQNLNIQSVIQNPSGMNMTWGNGDGYSTNAWLTFTNLNGSVPINMGGLRGDGYNTNTWGAWDEGMTNKMWTVRPASFTVNAATFAATSLAASSGHACIHADTSGNLTQTGSDCGSAGGGDTITSPNSTLNVGGTSSATTLDVNVGHANTWTANQTSAKWIASTGFDISGATTAGHYLRNNGTDYVDSAIQSADVPTLNQNTTGTAGSLSGGAAGSAPYQSAASTTAFLASPTTSGHTFVYAWQPSGSAIAPAAFDITNYLTSGTVTSIATTGPITGGTITSTGTIACATCVVASSPGAGIAHFAGSTQTVTSSAVALSDMATQTANTVVGNGTSGSAAPTALTMPSCSGATNALTWTTSGGSTAFGCNTISGGLSSQGANTGIANTTSGSAVPTSYSIPSGIQNYVTSTGYNQATAHQIGAPLLCSDVSGSGTAQSCTTSPSFTPASGDCVIYSTTTGNSGAGLTVNINSLGAKSVQKWLSTTTLAAGDVPASEPQLACYTGTVWNVYSIGNTPSGSSGTVTASAQYDTAYYPTSGTVATVQGAAISGFQYDSTSAAPVAATAANLGALMNIASGDLVYSGGTGSAPGGSPDFTISSHTLTGGASAILDMTAGTSKVATQSAGDSSSLTASDAFVTTAVTNAVAGVNPAVAVLAASTAAITGSYTQVGGGVGDTFTVTATGAFSLDGIAINTIGQRVLIKNQGTAAQNGVYTATVVGTTGISAIFTRALDYDTPSDVNNTGTIPVQSGTVNATTSWLLTSQVTSIGSAGSSLTYAQFSLAPATLLTASSPAAHGVMLGEGSQALGVTAAGTTGIPLIGQGGSADPIFGTALVAGGGTGDTSVTAYAPLLGGTTSTGALQSAVAGTSGQIFVSQGFSTKPTYIDFPERFYVPSANCNNTTAGAGWSMPSGGTATCRAGTNSNFGGYIAVTDTSSTFPEFSIPIPFDWDTASSGSPLIRFYLAYPGTDGSSSHTIIPEIKVACTTATSGVSDDPTFAAAHSSSTITLSSATANLFFSTSTVTMNSTDTSGCVAGGMMTIQVGRATDTATSAANFYGADVSFPRQLVVQAN
jgi:hypothetical protein